METSNIERGAGGAVKGVLRPTAHPLVPWEFTEAEVAAAPEEMLPAILEMYHKREELIRLAGVRSGALEGCGSGVAAAGDQGAVRGGR